MNIYIICPVRQYNKSEHGNVVEDYVTKLEAEGHRVYYPTRDAPQDSETGFELVEDECTAIKYCDEVHVFWDINSKGSHFDLGVAYACGNKIVFKHLFQEDKPGKTYYKAVNEKIRLLSKISVSNGASDGI